MVALVKVELKKGGKAPLRSSGHLVYEVWKLTFPDWWHVEAKMRSSHLISVVCSLVGSVDGDAQVLGLNGSELGEVHTETGEMDTSDFFIELLGEDVDTEREVLRAVPESNLSKDLVRERAGHDEGWVTSGTASDSQSNDITEER